MLFSMLQGRRAEGFYDPWISRGRKKLQRKTWSSTRMDSVNLTKMEPGHPELH